MKNTSTQNFLKEIFIGKLIKERIEELEITEERLCNYLNNTADDMSIIFNSSSIDTELLLKFSKILEYDFFRIYSQHLIFYSPPSAAIANGKKKTTKSLPIFRKNIYTKEVIDFIVELISTHKKTKQQIIEEYRIPKTTLYKWLSKYKKE